MIRVQAFSNPDPEKTEIIIHLLGIQDQSKLLEILNKSLNYAPEFGQDWFDLSDRLELFIHKNKPQGT